LCDFTFLIRLVLVGTGSGSGPDLGNPVVELTSTTGVYLGTENDLDLERSCMGMTGLDILGDFGLANGSGGGSRLAAGILASHTEQ
jgi:hypothetical protein